MPHQLPLESKFLNAWPRSPSAARQVFVALSGGADSVALLRLVHAVADCLGIPYLAAAHLDHRLRGAESDADADFVVELCHRLGVPLECQRTDVAALATAQGESIETAARRARYAFFEQLAARHGPVLVLTAHTADDQAETILHRIVRGTGLSGLRGIPAQRRLLGHSFVARPLLEFRRSELLSYLHQLDQPYRNDSSNQDVRYTRNRLRHELLVHLREHYNANVTEALLRLGSLAGEVHDVLDRQVKSLVHAVVRHDGHITTIARQPLCNEPPYLVREVLIAAWRDRGWPLQSMGYAQWELLADLLTANATELAVQQHIMPGHITAQRLGEQLRLWPASAD